MAEVVFVLGAGASAECGAPLMMDFLDRAEDLWLTSQAGTDTQHFARVFQSIAALKSVHAQFALDTNNLEAVFSAFEMGAMIERLGSIINPNEIEATRVAMGLIARTLQLTVNLPVGGPPNDRKVLPPGAYGQFVQLVRSVREHHRGRNRVQSAAAVITLNYDLALDYAFHFERLPVTYSLSDEDAPPEAVPLLKLHGSLNWSTCEKCGEVIPWTLADYFKEYPLGRAPYDMDTVPLIISDRLNLKVHCNYGLTGGPLLVPPTWNKSDNRLLREVWHRAAAELSEARYIVFAGYSFPESDLYFRYLLALGLAGETRIRKIVVVDPKPLALERLKANLSPNLQDRVCSEDVKFKQGIQRLYGHLDVKPTAG